MPVAFRRRTNTLARRGGLFDTRVIMYPAAVQSPLLRDARTVLRKWATFTRRKARNLIRPAKSPKPSRPNSAPKSRTHRLKNNIFWNYNEARMAAIVGPRKLPNTVSRTAMKALERGGYSRTYQGSQFGTGTGYQLKFIRKRPFMSKAAEATTKRIPNIWRSLGRLTKPGGIVV